MRDHILRALLLSVEGQDVLDRDLQPVGAGTSRDLVGARGVFRHRRVVDQDGVRALGNAFEERFSRECGE